MASNAEFFDRRCSTRVGAYACISVFLAAGFLGPQGSTEAAAQTQYGSSWTYTSQPDDMGGGTIEFAMVRSTNQFSFRFPYEGVQRAQLTVRQHPRWGLNAILQIERGQFMPCFDGCTATIRFDDDPPQTITLNPPSDMDPTVRFIENPADIVERFRESGTFRVEATFFNEGTRILEFSTGGLIER